MFISLTLILRYLSWIIGSEPVLPEKELVEYSVCIPALIWARVPKYFMPLSIDGLVNPVIVNPKTLSLQFCCLLTEI